MEEKNGMNIEFYSTYPEPRDENECMAKYFNVSAATNGLSCPPAWDSLFCWPPVAPGSTVSFSCEKIFPFLNRSYKKGVAYKTCDETGSWTNGGWTNYSECENLLEFKENAISPVAVSYVVFVGSIISLISLWITLFIFTYFKSLHCSRVRVHQNLVLSLIIHTAMMLAISLPGIFEGITSLFKQNDWFCKLVLTLKMYSAMTCIHWMFVEGLLLHSSITISVFQHEPPFKLYHSIGWGIPFVCVGSWVVLMTQYSTSPCWKGYGNSPFIWFITGPMIVALSVNAMFLVNIIRILIMKLRTSVSIETKQVKKAMKATALLFPLLGITQLLFCINPRDDAYLEHAYMLTNAILQSSQGLFVAVLYCFCNTEVQSVLAAAYKRAIMRRNPRRSCRGSRGSRIIASTTSTSISPELPNGSSMSQTRGRFTMRKISLVLPLKPLPEASHEDSEESKLSRETSQKETSLVN